MKSEIKLKPCPFCGGHGAKIAKLHDGDVYYVACNVCHAATREFDKPENAAAAWNRRAEPENRALTLAELEEHCKGGADAAPVWIEYKITKELSRWIYILEPEGVFGAQTIVSYKHNSNWRKRYGTFWRCWLRKPTAEEMANATWEG